jgi:hypothetical protein
MLSRLILLGLQLLLGWLATPYIMHALPGLGALRLFVAAVVVAVVVWIAGLVLSQVLRDTSMPSSATLVACLIVALIGAAAITWLPAVLPDASHAMHHVPTDAYPLIGAVLGYHLRR